MINVKADPLIRIVFTRESAEAGANLATTWDDERIEERHSMMQNPVASRNVTSSTNRQEGGKCLGSFVPDN